MRTGAGFEVTPAERIGAGGEGEVFAVAAPTSVVFKRFRPVAFRREPLLAERLRVMVAQPPDGWLEAPGGHVTMAWPADVVYDGDSFAGFLMPYLELSDTVELHRVTNPTDRRSAVGSTDWIHSFSWKYAVRTAANLAVSDGDRWEFCLLRITPTFHDEKKYNFAEARVRVTPETPGQAWPDSETPKAWWMEPGSVVGQVHRTRDFKLSSSALHVGPNLTFGSNYDKDEPFILAYNIQCPSAHWKFTRTRSRAIRGSHKLTMVVRMPKGCHAQAVIEISGTVVKHFRVGARRRNDVGDDPCRILLSESGVKQAKIDFITGNDD
jgi:hypothetical protein